jgi:CheY-like chemotaxis protein
MTTARNAHQSHTARERGWSPDGARALAGKHILVVDDDADTRLLVELIFTKANAVVQAAACAEDAFASLRDFRPQLVVSDINMPGEDGCSLMRRIRELAEESGGQTPSIALSAIEGGAEQREALRAGFTVFLKKPVAVASLIETALAVTSGR